MVYLDIFFCQAISLREMEDRAALEEKMGRTLSKQEMSRIGVSSLKLFLEELLQKRYMDSVPLIIPLLEKEHRSTTRKLNEINLELRLKFYFIFFVLTLKYDSSAEERRYLLFTYEFFFSGLVGLKCNLVNEENPIQSFSHLPMH